MAPGVLRDRAVRRIPRRLVDHLQPLDVRVAGGDRREPLLDLGELLLGRQRRHPRRLLVAPQQDVEVEREAVGLGEVVGLVELVPAHRRGARRARGDAPLAAVLRRDLVEVLREQRTRELADAPEPLVLAVDRELRVRGGRSQRRAGERRRGERGDASATTGSRWCGAWCSPPWRYGAVVDTVNVSVLA